MLVLNTPDKTKVLTLETSRPYPITVALPADAVNVPYAIANIAALRAAPTPATADVVRGILGYYTAGDLDMPTYRWSPTSTAADNGGSVIRPTAITAANPGRWLWTQSYSVINPKWYGVRGDGTTDDSATIQACFTASYPGNTVRFPKGSYLVGTGLTISGSNGALEGEGKFATEFKAASGLPNGTPLITVNGYGYRFSDFSLHGGDLGTKTGIKLTGYYNDIDRVFFGNRWSRCIYAQGLWASHFDSVDMANDTVNAARSGDGIVLEYSVNISISNSNIGLLTNCIRILPTYNPNPVYRSEGINISNCILVDSGTAILGDGITSINVSNSVLDLLLVSGIQLFGGFDAKLSNNWIAGVANNFVGCSVSNTFTDFKAIGNHFQNGNNSTGLQAFVCNGASFKIIGNTVNMPGGVAYGDIGAVAFNRFTFAPMQLLGTANSYQIFGNEGLPGSALLGDLELYKAADPRLVLKNDSRKWNWELNGNNARFVDITQNKVRMDFVGGTGTLNVAGPVAVNKTSTASNFAVTGLNNFADNAAAITGGLTAGDFYHTGGTLKVVT